MLPKALVWILNDRTQCSTDTTRTNFLFVGQGKTNRCRALVNWFLFLCEELGVSLAADKAEGPKHNLKFSQNEN